MFRGCSNLRRVGLSGGPVADLTRNADPFEGCAALEEIDLRGLKVKAEDARKLFYVRYKENVNVDAGGYFVRFGKLSKFGLPDFVEEVNEYNYLLGRPLENGDYVPWQREGTFAFLDGTDEDKRFSWSLNNNFRRQNAGRLIGLCDTYNIIYDLNGGNQEYLYKTSYDNLTTASFQLGTPWKTGYKFVGWTGSNGYTPQKSVTVNPREHAETLNYIANWEAIPNTVTVNSGEGIKTVTGAGNYVEGAEVTVTAELLDNTAQNSYTFKDWTIEAATEGVLGEIDTTSPSITFTMPACDVTLTANGTETLNSYTQVVKVRYENADGTFTEYNEVINREYNYGETVSWNTSDLTDFDSNTYETVSIEAYEVTEAKTTEITINRKIYELTLNKEKGIESVEGSGTYRAGEEVTINATVADGYTWKEWTIVPKTTEPETEGTDNTDSTGETENIDETEETNKITTREYTFIMPAENIEYIANTTVNTYTITYELDGGTVTGNPASYTVETENIILNNPTKEGYRFLGWTGSNGEEVQETVTINKGGTGNKNYIANWEINTYTITYDLAGGTVEENPTSYTVETENIILNNPTKEGYRFIGWTGSNGEQAQETVTINKGSTGDKSYTANWEVNTYTITYELDGGTVEGNPTSYTVETEDIILNNPIKLGYKFLGWTGSNGITPQKEIIIEQGSTGDKNYVANWQISTDIAYTVKHWQQNRTGNVNIKDEENYTLKNKDALEGIAGATVTPETKEYEGFTSPEKENLTITADGKAELNYYYTRNSYTVTLDKGIGIQEVTTAQESYLYEQEVTINAIVASGYTWRNWTDINNTTILEQTHTFIMPSRNVEYTANAEINTYTITYELGGGTVEGNPKSYTVETEDIILKKPIKPGYKFLGWTGSNGEQAQEIVTISKGSTGNKDYIANWEISTDIEYTVNHWKENLPTYNNDDAGNTNNYTLADTDCLEGIAGEIVTPKTKEYEGFISPEKQNLTITVDGRAELNYYYARRKDLTCTIKHIDKETKETIKTETLENQIYETEIKTNEYKKEIEGYNYDSVELETIKIGIGQNEIKIYYVKQEGKVIVHHYIYDEEENKYTTKRVAVDEEIIDKVGNKYSTKASTETPINYICINEQPKGHEGTIEKGTKEINYYYKLKPTTTESSIGSKVETKVEKDEEGKYIIKAGKEIKYKINYEVKIKDYKGKVSIEIEAKLPKGTEIDETKCDLQGGIYNKITNTIKWTEEIEEINTFANVNNNAKNTNPNNNTSKISALIAKITPVTYNEEGKYTLNIEKEIILVYAKDYTLDNINLDITGKTKLYYPEGYLEKEGEEISTKGNGKIIVHHYIYDQEKNENTTLKLVPNEEIVGKIGEEYETKPSDKISVNYECINEQLEGNKGTIEEGTKEISYYYKLKETKTEDNIGSEITSGGKQDEEGNWEIKKGEEIKYKINYEVKINDYKGKVKIEIKAKLPKGTKIDEEKCNLAEGRYNEESKIIKWEKEIEEIDTFTNGEYIETIEKEIKIVYAEDYKLKDANLKVEGNIITYYPEDYPGKGGETVPKEEEPDKPIETPEEKTGKIVIHHYIYDEADNKYTEVKLVEDEEIEKEIGEEYETKPSDKIPSNYECINEKLEESKGIIEKGTKEISYYYKLKEIKTEGSISTEIISGGKRDEEGNWEIRKGEEIKYKIRYEVKIKDYKGRATIEIKAKLPKGTKIDEAKCEFLEGKYNKETNTIRWEKEIENIDTFANGEYTQTIEKEIKIIYAEDYKLKDANLEVEGNIITYYPEDYPGKGGETIPKEDELDKPVETPEEKTGKVIVKYVDIDTNEEIIKIQNTNLDNIEIYGYEITGKTGEEYETEEKEIPYYILVTKAENSKGEIKEEEQIVTYYYRKQNFNIGIEKTIEGVILNGKDIKITNKETAKLEIKKEDIKKTDLIVKYKIKITNKGELGGTTSILEQIPKGYKVAYLPECWKINKQENLETEVNLEAGESKEIEVILRWENKEENLGPKTNIVKIEETTNLANFEDTNKEDNIGEATVIVSIKTGEVVNTIIIAMIMGALIISSYITIVTVRRKEPEIKDIKFLK